MRPVGSAPAYDLDKDSCVASVATQVARARARGLRRSGTESSSDSLLEGNGFELPVRGRGEAGCRAPFDAPGCLGRVGNRPSDPATAEREAQGKIRSQSLTPPQAGQGILRSAHGVVPQFIFITPGPRVSYERGRAPR